MCFTYRLTWGLRFLDRQAERYIENTLFVATWHATTTKDTMMKAMEPRFCYLATAAATESHGPITLLPLFFSSPGNTDIDLLSGICIHNAIWNLSPCLWLASFGLKDAGFFRCLWVAHNAAVGYPF